MKNARIKIATVFASLLFVVNLLVGGAAQALPLSTPAIPATMTDSLSDMMTEAVTSAGKNFLSSVLGEYTKTAESSFNDNFSTAKQTVNELADELERVADPNLKPADRDALLRKISDTQKSLQKIAASFNGLAENTEKFDNKLEGSVEDLLASIKGPVREQFTKNEDAFSQVSKALSAIATNASQVDTDNLGKTMTQVGASIKSLNQAFNLGSKALQAVSAFAS